jgi:hypothetical protein
VKHEKQQRRWQNNIEMKNWHIKQASSQAGASGCSASITNLDAPTRNSQNIKDKQLISPAKNVRRPTAPTCCFCWTTVVGNNSFSKMYVYLKRYMKCYRAHYVTEVFSWYRSFLRLCVYNIYIITRCMYNTYINVCTCMQPHRKQLQPLCSRSGYGPDKVSECHASIR